MNSIKPIKLNGGIIFVEVQDGPQPELPQQYLLDELTDTPEGAQLVSTQTKILEAGQLLQSTISDLATDVEESLSSLTPSEWAIEINIGFKGKTNPLPVLVSAEANAALKLTIKWVCKN